MSSRKMAALFFATFAAVSMIALVFVLANSQSNLGIETEQAVGEVTIIDDNDASNGQFIEFATDTSGFGTRCAAADVARIGQTNQLRVSADVVAEDGMDELSMQLTRVSGSTIFYQRQFYQPSQIGDMTYQLSRGGQSLPLEPAIYNLSILPRLDSGAQTFACVVFFEVEGTTTTELPQITCSAAYRQVGATAGEHLVSAQTRNTSAPIDTLYLTYADFDYAEVQTNQPAQKLQYRFPQISTENLYSSSLIFANDTALTTGGEVLSKLSTGFGSSCIGAGTVSVPDPDQSLGWNPPAGVDIVDPRPYMQQLQSGLTAQQSINILNGYFGDRFNQSQAKGYQPINQAAATIDTSRSPGFFNPVPINPNSAADNEQIRIAVHAAIDAWSRIPLSVSSRVRIDAIVLAKSINGPSYAYKSDYSTTLSTAATALNSGQVDKVGYQSMIDLYLHEHSHLFDFSHLEDTLGAATPGIELRYPPFNNANPPWFDGYEAFKTFADNQINPNGHPIGFMQKNKSADSQYEDVATILELFFEKGRWATLEQRVLDDPGRDPYLHQKVTNLMEVLQNIDPQLGIETIRAINELPSYLPNV